MKYLEIINKVNRGEDVPYKFIHILGGFIEGLGKKHNITCSGDDWKCTVRYNGKDYTVNKFSFDEVIVITNYAFAPAMLFYYKDLDAFYAKNETSFDYSTDIPEGAIFIARTETKWNNAILEMDNKDINEIWYKASTSTKKVDNMIEVKCMNNTKQEGYTAHSLISGYDGKNLEVFVEFMEHDVTGL